MNRAFLSFSSRLSRRILIVILLTITVVALFVVTLSTVVLKTMTTGYFLSELQVANESIERRLYGVEVAANMVVQMASHLKTPEQVFDAFRDAMEMTEKFAIGFGAAFEPYYFPSQGKWFEPYVYRLNDSIGQKQIGSPEYDYFNKEWYQEALQAKKGSWSDPYYEEPVTKKLQCSYSKPIINQEGRRVGVFSADFSLDWLYKHIKDVDAKVNQFNPLVPEDATESGQKPTSAYSIVIDGKGTYIYHPDKQRIQVGNFFEDIRQSPNDLSDKLSRGLASGKKGHQAIIIDGVPSYIFYTDLRNTDWTNAIIMPRDGLLIPTITIGLVLLLIIVLGLLLAYWICRNAIRHATKPLQLLAKSADEVAKGNFHTPLPELKYNDEISQLRDSFGNMQSSLTQYIDQLKTTTAQKTAFESELSIARDIQLSMVPTTFPERNDIDIYASMTPAKAVGGDLYDFFVRDNQLFFCIGDVSGKGVPAALLMMVTRSLFRAYSSHENMPDRIISRMNNDLSENNENCMFVTLFLGVLDLPSGLLRYCNAGHEAPVLIHKTAHPLPVNPSLPVGAIGDTTYQMQTVELEPQTTILFYTDGLNEAMNVEDNEFGDEKVFEEINRAIEEQQLSPKALIERMTHAVHDFVGDTEQSDDLTMLCLRIP